MFGQRPEQLLLRSRSDLRSLSINKGLRYSFIFPCYQEIVHEVFFVGSAGRREGEMKGSVAHKYIYVDIDCAGTQGVPPTDQGTIYAIIAI